MVIIKADNLGTTCDPMAQIITATVSNVHRSKSTRLPNPILPNPIEGWTWWDTDNQWEDWGHVIGVGGNKQYIVAN